MKLLWCEGAGREREGKCDKLWENNTKNDFIKLLTSMKAVYLAGIWKEIKTLELKVDIQLH